MKSFLITFKPQKENPEFGWPLESLLELVQRRRRGETVVEPWRFRNLKDIAVGDRVFLLLQGKNGPAVIGYGVVGGNPQSTSGRWYVPVEFESIVDPTMEALATKEDLRGVKGGQKFWRINSSGVLLPTDVGISLKALVVGNSPKPINAEAQPNPDWTRDELIVALNYYLKHRPNPPGKESQEIIELSEAIRKLGAKLHPGESSSPTFRNESGVYMKLMNFRSLDPMYTAGGKAGLVRGAKADKEVWDTFAGDPVGCEKAANAIMASLSDPEIAPAFSVQDDEDWIQEAPEGRLLTRLHVARERNRQLVESKRKQAMKECGKLTCEACGFDFAVHYGERGCGFIECHHTKPVASLTEGHKTHLDDLALVCANCHRMIHRAKKWLTISELKALIEQERRKQRQLCNSQT